MVVGFFRELSGASRIVRGRTGVIIDQPSASLSVDCLRVVQFYLPLLYMSHYQKKRKSVFGDYKT